MRAGAYYLSNVHAYHAACIYVRRKDALTLGHDIAEIAPVLSREQPIYPIMEMLATPIQNELVYL